MSLESVKTQLKRVLTTGKKATGASLKKCISQIEAVIKDNEDLFKSGEGKTFYDQELAPILERGVTEQLKTYTKAIENNRNWCKKAKDSKKAKQYLEATKKELEKQKENIKSLGGVGEKYLKEITEFIAATESEVANAVIEDQLKAITAKIDAQKKKIDYYLHPKSSYMEINKNEVAKRIDEIKAIVEKEKNTLLATEEGKKLITDLESYYKSVDEEANKLQNESEVKFVLSQILPRMEYDLKDLEKDITSYNERQDADGSILERDRGFIMSNWEKIKQNVEKYLVMDNVKKLPEVESILAKVKATEESINKMNESLGLEKRIKEEAKYIKPGPEEVTKFPYRNLDEESMHSSWEKFGKKYCGKIVFSTKKIENDNYLKQEFEQGDEIHAKAFWPHAIRNYPLGELDGKPIYGPKAIASIDQNLHALDLIPTISVNGKKLQTLKPDGTPYKFTFNGVKDALSQYKPGNQYDPYAFHQHIDFIMKKDYPNLQEEIEVYSLWLTKFLSELGPGKHTISVDLSFRLQSLEGSEHQMKYNKQFPFKTTEISAPIASGSFTINVKSKVIKPKISEFKNHQRVCSMSVSDAEKNEKIITGILSRVYATSTKPQHPVLVKLRSDWEVSELNELKQPVQWKLFATAVMERKKSEGWLCDSYGVYYNILALSQRYVGASKEIDTILGLKDWPLRVEVPKDLFE